jgi:hypothetical protein
VFTILVCVSGHVLSCPSQLDFWRDLSFTVEIPGSSNSPRSGARASPAVARLRGSSAGSASFVRDKRSKQLNSEVLVVEHLDRLETSVASLENLLQPIDGSIFPIFYASHFDDNAGDQPWSKHPYQNKMHVASRSSERRRCCKKP